MLKEDLMKKTLYLFLFNLFLVSNLVNAQSIWFVDPTNSKVVSGGGTQTQVYVSFAYNYSLSSGSLGMYAKLITHNGTYLDHGSSEIPQWFYVTPGTYTWKLELYEYFLAQGYFKTATATITFYTRFTIEVENNIASWGGTDVKIDYLTKPSGSPALKSPGDNLAVGAIDQSYNGDFYVWKPDGTDKSKWEITKSGSSNPTTLSFNKNYTYSVQTNDNNATITGYLRIHQLPTTPSISMSGGWGDNPVLTFSGGGQNVDHYVLKKEYDFGSGFGSPYYVNPATNPYTDVNVERDKFGDLVARYSVKVVDNLDYESSYSSTVSTLGQSLWKKGNLDKDDNINEYALNSNYPNPFNPTTQINYQIPKDGNVTLVVYNSLGQEIKTLVNQYQSSGSYVVQFDASELPSGVYIYKLTSGNFSAVKKMLLTK
jgi:hypothetical protein